MPFVSIITNSVALRLAAAETVCIHLQHTHTVHSLTVFAGKYPPDRQSIGTGLTPPSCSTFTSAHRRDYFIRDKTLQTGN